MRALQRFRTRFLKIIDNSMIYPACFEEKIGFDLIKEDLKKQAVHPIAKELASEIQYSSEYEIIQQQLVKLEEFRQILEFGTPFPEINAFDLRPEYVRISISGTWIEPENLLRLRQSLLSIRAVLDYFKPKEDVVKYPELSALGQDFSIDFSLFEDLNRIINDKGQIKDTASPELQNIRRQMIKISREADKKMRLILKSAKQEGVAKEDAEMTLRNGRLCIPVPAALKRKFNGFIHDESASGQTVFMEPTEIFEANNVLRDLSNAERREIIRILTEFTELLRPQIPELLQAEQFLGAMDFIRAKAKLALKHHAIIPVLHPHPVISWQKAFHPLLYLHLKSQHKEVVPLSIDLCENQRILIISGPNAGGKSVALKTAGLMQYMLQCGLAVSVAESSEFGLFKDFFIAIGDEQSIDNDLSTYSSHLSNMKILLEQAQPETLFLIDEFGSGTDPDLGGAMAEAILEQLYQSGAYGIITTHFGNLKHFADTHPKIANGAMLFDVLNLQPLFELKIGKPGSSFTYEIAQRIGFPENVLNHAKQIGGMAKVDYELKLQELENVQTNLEQDRRMLNFTDDRLAELIQEYENKLSDLKIQKKTVLEQAKIEAQALILKSNQIIEQTIREIREAQADKAKTKIIRRKVENLKQELKQDVAVSKHEKELEDALHKLSKKFSVKEDKPALKKNITLDGKQLGDVLTSKTVQFNPTLDLRGKRVEESLAELALYLDDAVFLGVSSLKIIHGKGNGILRQFIRKALSERKDIKSFQDESIQLGGAGVTIVLL